MFFFLSHQLGYFPEIGTKIMPAMFHTLVRDADESIQAGETKMVEKSLVGLCKNQSTLRNSKMGRFFFGVLT